MNDPRQRHEIEEDLVMAVLNGDETTIARLQQELAIAERIRGLDIPLD